MGALSLGQVRAALHTLIASQAGGAPSRRWWEAMNDDETNTSGEDAP